MLDNRDIKLDYKHTGGIDMIHIRYSSPYLQVLCIIVIRICSLIYHIHRQFAKYIVLNHIEPQVPFLDDAFVCFGITAYVSYLVRKHTI